MTENRHIDPEILDSLISSTGNDVTFLNEVIDLFLEDSPHLLADLETGVRAGDAELVRRTAHSLKSNCATLGAVHLAALLRELERQAASGTLSAAEPALAAIMAEYPDVRCELMEYRSRPAT